MTTYNKKKADREYYLKNRDKVCERSRAWRKDNPEKAAKKDKEYREANLETYLIYQRKYASSHRDKKRAYDKQHYNDNKEKRLEQAKRYQQENKESRAVYSKEYRKNNKEALRLVKTKWIKENPERARAHSRVGKHKRRARIAEVGGSFTREDIRNLYATQEAKCYYCSISIEEEYHIDHMTPIVRGGSNDVSNLCLTDPECNMRKHTKTAEEFISER